MKQTFTFNKFMQLYYDSVEVDLDSREKGVAFAKLLRLNNTRLSHLVTGTPHDPYYGNIDEDYLIQNWTE